MDSNTTLHFDWALPLVADLDAAASSVWVSSLSLHPPRVSRATNIGHLWTAIESAASRGLAVHFVLPRTNKSHPATAFNTAAGDRLHAIGAHVHTLNPARLLHAKTVSIDDALAWVGSGNWTAAASAHNREAYIRAASPQLAARLRLHWLDEIEKG